MSAADKTQKHATAKAARKTFSTDTFLKCSLVCTAIVRMMMKSVSCCCVCVCVEAEFSQIQSQLCNVHTVII